MSDRTRILLTYALIFLGVLQSLAYVIRHEPLRAAAQSTWASPVPDVFGGTSYFEPNAYMPDFIFRFDDGSSRLIPKSVYTDTLRRAGPVGRFFRFSGYITVLNWMPYFPEPTYTKVLRHGFCTGGIVADLLSLRKQITGVRFYLRNEKDNGKPDLDYEIACGQ